MTTILNKHHRPKKTKVFSYLHIDDIKRMDYICEQYGYSSKYKLIQHLLDVFLRLIDPENSNNDNPIPYEIEKMFIPLKQYEKIRAKQDKERRAERKEQRLSEQNKDTKAL